MSRCKLTHQRPGEALSSSASIGYSCRAGGSDGVADSIAQTCDTMTLSNELFINIINALPFPFIVVNARTYSVVLANSAARVRQGSETFCFQLAHQQDEPCQSRGHQCPLAEVSRTGRPVRVEHVHQDTEGRDVVVEVHGYPVKNDTGEVELVVISSLDITARREAERNMTELNQQLRAERRALEEKHIALQEVLGHVAGHRRQVATTMQRNVEETVMPALRQLSHLVAPEGLGHLAALESSLKDIMSPFVGRLQAISSKLSPREIEICQLLKNGASTKDTAAALHISEHTVLKLRQRVRTKLGLNNSKTNLASYLRSLE